MATITNFKDIIDLPEWRPIANCSGVNTNGVCFGSDPRNTEDRIPYVYRLASSSFLEMYNIKNDEWTGNANLSLATPLGLVVYPSQGPRGTLAAGNTSTKLILSTALPAAVGNNQMANRGDGIGYKIRIVDNAAGASGKIEERYIVGNTSGTTPTIYLDSALSFTPTTGSVYEFLSGKVYLVGSAAFRSYDILTNSFSAALSVSGLTTSTNNDFVFINFDELQVPYNRLPGEGFFGNLVATATAAGTITGTLAGAESSILSNEYRNFQIRIVQDTVTPTAVGQRRRISSHTAGPSAVFTLSSNWTVTPSATATFVLELDGDKILAWVQNSSNTFNYNITANTWDTTTWVTRATNPNSNGLVAMPSWGLAVSDLGVGKEARHSYIYTSKANATTSVDLFDIAGGATGAWTSAITTGGAAPFFQSGLNGVADLCTMQGRYYYINNAQRNLRFDVRDRVFEGWCFRPYPDVGQAINSGPSTTNSSPGTRMATALFVDGSCKLQFIIQARASNLGSFIVGQGHEMFSCLIQR